MDTTHQQEPQEQPPQAPLGRPRDAEDAALDELRARVAAEAETNAKAGEQQPTTPAPDATKAGAQDQGTAQNQKATEQQPAKPAPLMVPIDALHAARKYAQEVQARALVLQGQNQAMAAMLHAAQQGQQHGATAPAADPIAEIETEIGALAKRFDDGEISMAEFKSAELKLTRRLARAEAEAAIPAQVQQPQQPAYEDLQLAMATEKLTQDYPVLVNLSAEDLAPFEQLAYQQAAREGQPIQPGALGTLHLRERIAKLATQFYGQQQPSTPSPQVQAPQPPAGLSPRAQALDQKLQMQASMPPDVSKLGNGGNATLGNAETAMATINGLDTEDAKLAYIKANPHLRNIAFGGG